jgi:hypothetical protein
MVPMGSPDKAPAAEPAVAALERLPRQLGRLSHDVSQVVDEILSTDQLTNVAVDDLRLLFSTAVRLYAGITSVLTSDINPLDGDITPADAAVTARALLEAQHLNPFGLTPKSVSHRSPWSTP